VKHQIKIHDVPRETYKQAVGIIEKNSAQISSYISRLLWWNNKISLISRTITKEELQEHVIHSIIPMLIFQNKGTVPKHIVDCGTGGGLPGIPIAICFPNINITLNDISIKKILAIKDMIRHLDIDNDNISFSRCDVRALHVEGTATVLSKHAFKIDFLVNALQNQPIDQFVFYKGGIIGEELNDIDKEYKVVSHDLSTIKKKFYDAKLIIQVIANDE